MHSAAMLAKTEGALLFLHLQGGENLDRDQATTLRISTIAGVGGAGGCARTCAAEARMLPATALLTPACLRNRGRGFSGRWCGIAFAVWAAGTAGRGGGTTPAAGAATLLLTQMPVKISGRGFLQFMSIVHSNSWSLSAILSCTLKCQTDVLSEYLTSIA